MGLDEIGALSQKELEQFKAVCNQLLSRTFIVRAVYKNSKEVITNPDYLFLARHFDLVRDYLLLADWDLRHDDFNGFYYVINTDSANRKSLNKLETALLLALRMLYDDNQERMGLEHDVDCTVRDVLEKIITEYHILSGKPNMDEVKKALTYLESHSLIQRLEGRYNQTGCKLVVLPSIVAVVSNEKLKAVVDALQKEEQNEEAEENTVN